MYVTCVIVCVYTQHTHCTNFQKKTSKLNCVNLKKKKKKCYKEKSNVTEQSQQVSTHISSGKYLLPNQESKT